jgi:hypothetical protein
MSLSRTTAQNFLIPGDSVYGGIIVRNYDTIIYPTGLGSYISGSYSIDVNDNNQTDIKFNVSSYMGGMYDYNYNVVNTYDSTYVIADTNFLSWAQYYDHHCIIQDTIIKYKTAVKFYKGDTIHVLNNTLIASTYITRVHYEYTPSSYYAYYLNHFIGDTSYIAFIKFMYGNPYIFYLKVFVNGFSSIKIYYLATNCDILSIKEENLNEESIYPNPCTGSLFIPSGYNTIVFYNILGEKVAVYYLEEDVNRIDISSFRSGIYILRMMGPRGQINSKIIKE